jgi:hypothetical protein
VVGSTGLLQLTARANFELSHRILTQDNLNPVEALWSSLKGVELANLAGDTLEEVTTAAQRGIQRIRDTHHLAYSFLRHCGLSLW